MHLGCGGPRCDLNGKYFKKANGEYRKADNTSKIYIDDTQACLGSAGELLKTPNTNRNHPGFKNRKHCSLLEVG